WPTDTLNEIPYLPPRTIDLLPSSLSYTFMAASYTEYLLGNLPFRLWKPLTLAELPWKTEETLNAVIESCPLDEIQERTTQKVVIGHAKREPDGSFSFALSKPGAKRIYYNKQED